jgi:coproporphyrinogen III oxidase-like Fe-S oxidoreductase
MNTGDTETAAISNLYECTELSNWQLATKSASNANNWSQMNTLGDGARPVSFVNMAETASFFPLSFYCRLVKQVQRSCFVHTRKEEPIRKTVRTVAPK